MVQLAHDMNLHPKENVSSMNLCELIQSENMYAKISCENVAMNYEIWTNLTCPVTSICIQSCDSHGWGRVEKVWFHNLFWVLNMKSSLITAKNLKCDGNFEKMHQTFATVLNTFFWLFAWNLKQGAKLPCTWHVDDSQAPAMNILHCTLSTNIEFKFRCISFSQVRFPCTPHLAD